MLWKDFPALDRQGQIQYLAMRDGTNIRTACWPSEDDSRGIIVLVNGHREYMEKYSEFISDFLKRDFAVYTLDNRGQGLSDRMLPDRSKSHAEIFDDFSDDLNEFISKIVMADPRAKDIPVFLVGHSMGGHLCLRYLHDYPGVIKKAVIMAPMIEFNLGNSVISAVTKFIIRLACKIGFSTSFAFGQAAVFSKDRNLIRQKLLTHDKARYDVEAEIIESNPALYVGGATFGWLNKAMESTQKIQSSGFLDKISIPILIALAGSDQVVKSAASAELFIGHDNFNVVTIEGSRHEIYREKDKYRDYLWQEIDFFLGIK
ncbi:MAG: alpha/beta hydrolase [Emcibacter sp.]|nr:alpha/beta hydrolase [Emcibacter sp.]